MEKSASIKNLALALCQFQGKMESISKDSDNPFYKSKYASLSTILHHIQKPLVESGLCFSQMPDELGLTSILIHAETGEFLQARYTLTPVKSDPQSVGSAITYARRYALGAILGLNIDEDDDGNASSKPDNKGLSPKVESKDPMPVKQWLNPGTAQWTDAIKYLSDGGKMESITKKYSISVENQKKLNELT